MLSLLQRNAASKVTVVFEYNEDIYICEALRIAFLTPYLIEAREYFQNESLSTNLSCFMPIGTLCDIYGPLQLTLFESDDTMESLADYRSRLLNGWKESAYLMHGSNHSILSLMQHAKEGLIDAVHLGYFEQLEVVNIEEMQYFPLKCYTPDLVYEKHSPQTLIGDVIQSGMSLGIVLPSDETLLSLIPLMCADGFVHVTNAGVSDTVEAEQENSTNID